jgi:cytochrome c oxidase cbb3-type subunit 3
MTTGHEWNGIKELNSPVPRIVWALLICAATFAVAWTVLMPSWPGINGYFRGLIGVDQRTAVAETIAAANIERAEWTRRINEESFADIQADPALMQVVRETGPAIFGDNCAACHGAQATGGPGYPNIAEAKTLWGEDADTIAETIRVGINSSHAETRYSQMLAFGRDQMLPRADIDKVVDYVRTLSDPTVAATLDATALADGKQIFADNCASCHGDDGTGMAEVGSADLADQYWIYGGDRQSILTTVYYGRAGHMPTWEGRLSPLDIKLLTLYLLDLRAEKRT